MMHSVGMHALEADRTGARKLCGTARQHTKAAAGRISTRAYRGGLEREHQDAPDAVQRLSSTAAGHGLKKIEAEHIRPMVCGTDDPLEQHQGL